MPPPQVPVYAHTTSVKTPIAARPISLGLIPVYAHTTSAETRIAARPISFGLMCKQGKVCPFPFKVAREKALIALQLKQIEISWP